jgi:glycine/D-amino acid oxidase-like deaminating enzyme
MSRPVDVEYLVIGGGFYGCCLGLFLRSISKSISIVEKEDHILTRASRTNQARIHTGFHYPRNAVTAVKSLKLHERFAADFPEAVCKDFQMLYAIARRRSLVRANRFFRMFRSINAPIRKASPSESALFDPATIEAVYACVEHAFDYSVLRRLLANKIDSLGIDLQLKTEVVGLEEHDGFVVAKLSTGKELVARHVFNVTYSNVNEVLKKANLSKAGLKFEFTEVALVEPPEQIAGYGITVMDGPFFSTMPFPSERLYSLTHVRYTPHFSWTDSAGGDLVRGALETHAPVSKAKHMILDSRRYVPSMADAVWKRSLYEIKSVLLRNEVDDGRPILYQRAPANSRVISILGGKIDNIYDLFELIRVSEPEWAAATDQFVVS